MASNAATLARRIRVFRDNALSPQQLSANLAAFARQKRDDLIAAGTAPPSFRTFVDGREGAQEETVRPDGAIVYKFNVLGQAAILALKTVIIRSPVHDGDYRSAWFVAVDGVRWTGDLNDIPQDAEVWISNPLPYARKIDTGHMRMSVPPGIIEDARQVVLGRFKTIEAQGRMMIIPASMGGGYILKGHFRQGHRKNARTALRSDTQRGATMTYPTLVLRHL